MKVKIKLIKTKVLGAHSMKKSVHFNQRISDVCMYDIASSLEYQKPEGN